MYEVSGRLLLVTLLAAVTSCTSTMMTNRKADAEADTPECALMKEVCAEAREFQAEWERMPEQEQKDMAAVLNTYNEHCAQASDKCASSLEDAEVDSPGQAE